MIFSLHRWFPAFAGVVIMLCASVVYAESLSITDVMGKTKAALSVEIADTEPERQRGLMFRHDVPMGTGMVFLFERPQQVQMWMMNTLVPLDVLFADASGRIVHIERDMIPQDLTPRGPQKPVTVMALELKAGSVARYKIKLNDRLAIHPNNR